MSNELIIYNTEDQKAKINLKLEDGTIWLSQLEIAELFQSSKQNISKHIKAIFSDGELDEKSTVNYKLTVQKEGKGVRTYSLTIIFLNSKLYFSMKKRPPDR